MNLSQELQIGKAGEHFVCFDLISQGFNAFLADQGLPYDVVVDYNGTLYKVQVKTTLRTATRGRAKDVYAYSLRISKGGKKQFQIGDVNFFAFVALQTKKVAYFPSEDMIIDGKVKQTIHLKDLPDVLPTNKGCQTVKYMECFNRFPIQI